MDCEILIEKDMTLITDLNIVTEQIPVLSKNRPELRALDMFFNDPLDDEMELKKQLNPMNYYEILQLDKSFFDNFDEAAFKRHMRKLVLFYHPDKNPTNIEKATIVFQMIGDASECMRHLNKRDQYMKSGVDSKDEATVQKEDYNLSKDWWTSFVDETLSALNAIEIRAEALSESGSNALVIPGDTFEKVCNELTSLWQERIVHQDVYAKQIEVFKAVKNATKTGNDFWSLSKLMSKLIVPRIQLNDGTIYSVRDCFQDAARLKHPEGMRALAGSALSGFLPPYEQSVPWAIKSIIYLEKKLIPILEKSTSDKNAEAIEKIRSGITRARERIIDLSSDEEIPMPGSERFTQVVGLTIDVLNKNKENMPSFELSEFRLSDDLFSDCDELSPLKNTKLTISAQVVETDTGCQSNSNLSQKNIFSEDKQTQIKTALSDSIKSIKSFPIIGDWDKTNKVQDLEKIRRRIVNKLDTEDSTEIIRELKLFAAKANEYRLIKKTTTSFKMFKEKIGAILSEKDINEIEACAQKHYKKPT